MIFYFQAACKFSLLLNLKFGQSFVVLNFIRVFVWMNFSYHASFKKADVLLGDTLMGEWNALVKRIDVNSALF